MKKLALLNELKDNNVKSTNLRSFVNKSKRNKEMVVNFEKTRKWLIEAEEIEAEKERQAKIKKMANKFNLSVKKYNELYKLCDILMSNINSGYSMGDVKKVYVNEVLFFYLDDTQEYARSCKYRPTHGLIRLDINKKQLLSLHKSHCNTITCAGEQLKTYGFKGSFLVEF